MKWFSVKLISNKILGVLIFFMHSLTVFTQNSASFEYPEWMYQKRFEALNQQSPILLEYNDQVKAYIDVYLVKRHDHFQNILNRSLLYFPIFEEYLDRYKLPLELKYLAVVESALDPKAKSSSGAMGLWQFLLNSGKMFDLNVTSFTDDRCDVYKSTDAACRYLKYLYNTFGDWQLALAAYNGGAGELQKAIQKSGKKNYWELRPYLTEQMRGYVPAFMAVAYCMNNYNKHGFEIDSAAVINYWDIDSVEVTKPTSLSKIASTISVDLELLSQLNPIYTKDYIPVYEKPISIIIPKKSIPSFFSNEKLLYAQIYKNSIYKSAVNNQDFATLTKSKKIHTVSSGEYLHKIAMTYNCSVEDILKWNKLKNKRVYSGQHLTIFVQQKAQNQFFFAVAEVSNKDISYIKGSIKEPSNKTYDTIGREIM